MNSHYGVGLARFAASSTLAGVRIFIPHPLAAGAKPLGFPKGRSEALPFGHRQGAYPADDIKLITGIPAGRERSTANRIH